MAHLKDIKRSLTEKLISAHFHKFMSQQLTMGKYNDTTHYNLRVAGYEFTAMMLALHSSLDLLGHWVNQKYKMNITGNLYFSSILKKSNDHPELYTALNILNADAEYLIDFCNYNKHNNIVLLSTIGGFMGPGQMYELNYIESFTQKGRTHPPKDFVYERENQFNIITEPILKITNIKLNFESYLKEPN